MCGFVVRWELPSGVSDTGSLTSCETLGLGNWYRGIPGVDSAEQISSRHKALDLSRESEIRLGV
jgi:hypothetical protein